LTPCVTSFFQGQAKVNAILGLVDLGSKSGFSTDDSIPPQAVVRFDSGMALMVAQRIKWEWDAG
jgi:hypothetical protein